MSERERERESEQKEKNKKKQQQLWHSNDIDLIGGWKPMGIYNLRDV